MKLELQGLAGQVAKALLDTQQKMRLVWKKLPEAEQQALIESNEALASTLVEEVTNLILSQGGGVLDCTIHKVGINKETIEAKISVARDDDLATYLMKSAHSPGKLTFVTAGAEMKSLGKRATPDTNQPAMFTDNDDGEPLFH